MTVVTDHDIRVCSYCKRPTELLTKDESNNANNAGNDESHHATNHVMAEHNNLRNSNFVDSNSNSNTNSNSVDSRSGVPPKRLGLIRRLMPRYMNPRIERILYWRDIRKTTMIFMAGIMLLGAISYYSLISVLSHLSLALLTSIFILKLCSRLFGKSYLITNWPKCDNLDKIVLKILNILLIMIADLRDIVFVKDLIKTLKFCFILHIWTVIGELMNGYTLLVSIFVGLFIIPKTFELMWPKLLKSAENGIQYCKSKIPFYESDE